jgi:hypothetical protein
MLSPIRNMKRLAAQMTTLNSQTLNKYFLI